MSILVSLCWKPWKPTVYLLYANQHIQQKLLLVLQHNDSMWTSVWYTWWLWKRGLFFWRNVKTITLLLSRFKLKTKVQDTNINPLLALMYQNILDLNVACQAKRTQTYWHVRKFKSPLKKTQPSCPCSRDLNWTRKGLRQS
jgi:hypothetical protein